MAYNERIDSRIKEIVIGWIMVNEEGLHTDDELKVWLRKAKAFVDQLPPK